MITRVDTVLIGKNCPASYSTVDALNVGDVALFDENRNIITDAAKAVKATSVYVGVAKDKVKVSMPNGSVESKANIEFSNRIDKTSHPSFVIGEYSAPVEDKVVIDLTSASIVTGHRYVIRIVYNDIYEAPGQFTHTYEVYASSDEATDLINAFEKKINAHTNRRITVSKTATTLTLTAMPKTDNDGVYSISEYTTVSMDVTFYKTIPSALVSNYPEKVSGATITKTQGNPGKGYWKQVRDIEKRMQGYKGHKFTDAYPAVVAPMMVEENATYDYVTIENDNLYLSNDNQYIKTTPLTTEVYVKSGSLSSSQFSKNLLAFVTGNEGE